MNISHAGEAGELRDIYTTTVYDNTNGEIIHLHHTVIFEGATIPSEEEMTMEALTQAKQAGIDCSRASTLHLGNQSLNPECKYKIDTATKSLVEVSRATREGLDSLH
jgi:hypothetical protein